MNTLRCKKKRLSRVSLLSLSAVVAGAIASLVPVGFADAELAPKGVAIAGRSYTSWGDYFTSSEFEQGGRRCGKPATKADASRQVAPSDCTYSVTNPTSDYDTVEIYQVPVVVHIIQHTNGDGQVSDALVHSQIEVLNEDFRGLSGTPGAPGYDVGIEFVLADTDPNGNPTTGITRSTNNTWFNDGGSYWNTLAWDTSRYMNVYTNSADGALGYVPDLPQGGIAGDDSDRVVILWSAFGRNSIGGPPYDQGRTLTHEVGHYLGLEHTFNGGCGTTSAPGCYASGDLICDTNAESSETSGCPGNKSSCGSPDPTDNYMDYSDDTCMDKFTNEQSHRMRCSLVNYRADLFAPAVDPVCGNDSQETGEQCDGDDDSACPGVCGVDCTCPAPECGNDVVEAGEECDGADAGACVTGTCQLNCSCPAPVCGNDVSEAGEECDGNDDSACPGQCAGDCGCPQTCNLDDLFVADYRLDARKFQFKFQVDNFFGDYDGLDPREGFVMSMAQRNRSYAFSIPSFDGGWEKSKPAKGKFKWKGFLGGIRAIKATEKVSQGVWRIQVKGKDVSGAQVIDLFDPRLIDVEISMEGMCAGGSF